MYDGITFAKKHGFTCLNEFHEDISCLWCTSDDATLRLYLGGDQGGNLLHVSLSSLVENDRRFSALWPEVGLLVMEESELDLDVLTDIVELRGFGELSRPVPMGRRMVHASAGWCVVFTTPGWADGLRQPSFDPQLADVEPRLMGFGDFECDDN